MSKSIAQQCLPLLALLVPAAAPAAERQDLGQLRELAEQFLLAQAASLPGTPSVRVGPPDSRLQLARCDAPQAFAPGGARVVGKTTVGIRCDAPVQWNVFLPATVGVKTGYLASAAPLSHGQRLGSADVVTKHGDLATLPAGVLTDIEQAQGRTLQQPVAAGVPLSRAMLRSQPVVQPGQQVRLVAQGRGFSVSSEARALTGGAEGDLVQARTAGGQVVAGVAQADGVLAVKY
ncbi:MAG: flagellar basal body P-ring formation protein FlgA [Burkholderiaceae bacterium]|nr:flagellar basal body P-ring formation protein FlgA [Burkholderiaceae bacterium]